MTITDTPTGLYLGVPQLDALTDVLHTHLTATLPAIARILVQDGQGDAVGALERSADAISEALAWYLGGLHGDEINLHEVACPNCEAVIRAPMADKLEVDLHKSAKSPQDVTPESEASSTQ